MANVTGRDGFILAQALAYAIAALDRVPEMRQPRSNKEDMIRLLEHTIADDGYRAHVLERAKATLTGIGWYSPFDPPPSEGNIVDFPPQ